MKQTILSVKGTRDFYPEEMSVRTWLYNKIRKVSESFGYEEYEGPFLEHIDLYAAKSGEELVKEQAFSFQDRGGDWITLRPELTPTLARMVAQKQSQLVFPLRWWSYGPMWRYEKPQKGRSREFFQWNIDLIGVDSPEVDAELAAIGASFFREAGLTPDEVHILVNDRRLVEAELDKMDIPAKDRKIVFHFIDHRDKMRPAEWLDYGVELGLTKSQAERIQTMVADKSLWEKSKELRRFFEATQSFGVSDYLKYSPEVVRGLDYYTGTVFEARDRDGDFRAILGGGRYDNLVSDVGGTPVPAMGFAMGDMVIKLVLEKFKHLPSKAESLHPPILVTVFDENTFLASIELSQELRRNGFDAAVYPQPGNISKQFKYAGRIGSRLAIVIGPDELANGEVTIKNLVTYQQQKVARKALLEIIPEILAEENGL